MVSAEEGDRILIAGRPDIQRCNNKVITSKYSLFSFLPVAIVEQFRRVANMYFLIIGVIMALGWYTPLFESAISPWTTLGPLAFVISISLLQEGSADLGRHRSDMVTNNHRCVVLRRANELEEENGVRDSSLLNGQDVDVNIEKSYNLGPSMHVSEGTCRIAFESVKRMDIRQGNIVLIRNREMVPADFVLLASSADNGNAYIETSSIDGETNLKLRATPTMPKEVLDELHRQSAKNVLQEESKKVIRETLEQATKRICRITALGFPNGPSVLENPANPSSEYHGSDDDIDDHQTSSGFRLLEKTGNVAKRGAGAVRGMRERVQSTFRVQQTALVENEVNYVTVLKTEPPNASVNTFNGLLILPPVVLGGPSIEIPLNAENILLRGAVLRNTEWAIGIACYTGKDTKLVMNSFDTPSKFSRLDQLMNRIVVYVLCITAAIIAYLSTFSVITSNKEFDELWYIGLNKDPSAPWPYNQNLKPPKWSLKPSNWLQVYMLFITLLNNFVPLSLYVTIEMVTLVMRMLINLDINMYDVYTDTRTVARSTTVTDLGQVQYIFSDKTGTLTQNVMKFKRCSVDSLVFGAPIVKEKLGENEGSSHPFHPLSKLLIGKLPEIPQNSKASVLRQHSDGLVGNMSESSTSPRALTFNAEMFLRVMSLCHTVVVEKDLDLNEGKIKATESNKSRSFGASIHRKIKKTFGKKTSPPEVDVRSPDEAEVTPEEEQPIDLTVKGNGGAPSGFAYQAESPDEGALVEASSLQFNFQVVARDSLGIRVSMAYPSLLSDPSIADGLKDGSLNEMQLAADTASSDGTLGEAVVLGKGIETWEVLAVNKFDSTRKRMSVIVRSPPELGSIPMVLVKGADSAMLDPKILRNPAHIMIGDEDANDLSARASEPNIDNAVEWDKQAVLSMQSHLGEFAREGLRTLVLGVRVLSESECSEWLSEYASAAASLKNRDAKLTAAAAKIEAKIHIVGATAIEDKLQDGVPETIAHLGKAGIKLWVLTGDKRETAMEIGYATNVLNEKMRPGLTVVSQGSASEVQTKMAMAFLALIKHAKLPEYQKSSIGEDKPKRLESVLFTLGKRWRRFSRAFRRGYHRYFISIFLYLFSEVNANSPALKAIDEEERKEEEILQLTQRYRNVRNRAEKIVRDYLNSPEGMAHRRKQTKVEQHNEVSIEDMNMPSEGPDVFHRADSARQVLSDRRNVGQLSESELRDLTMVNLTAHEVSSGEFGLVDEDLLSMKSFLPTDDIDIKKTFDSRRRNILEKVFAVDKDVRHGRLKKHMNKSVLSSIEEDEAQEDGNVDPALSKETASLDGSRGLVIEGAALEKLLGDSELEEILFAVANTCNSVIACRVSPAQKAQLVQLVRRYVVPEPVTLAIGDGANDVGMIQEAHVGIGISGKEGQQAVNASDFAIAQFRFLLDLTLIHGRWNFMRLSTVVLFSFYKNAVMAGVLIVFSRASMFSGSPLFDEWLIAMLNFVAAMPIIVLGAFDRCLDRQYVLKHPETYTATRRNELITKRTLMRWIILIIIHICCVYFLSVPMLSVDGAGSTSAFQGLMSKEDPDRPGNGEGGDLKSVGFVAFSSMILLFCYKVLWESRSIIIGQWPAFRCWKKGIEGWPNRLAYTWLSCGYCSIAFYLFAIYLYQALGRYGPSSYSAFVDTVFHAFNTRVRTWMALIFIPITAMSLDIAGKVFSNLFFPTQTQIHVEIFATGKRNCNPTSMLKCCGKGSSNQSNPEVSV